MTFSSDLSKTAAGTWCALPWVHLFVGEAGTLRPCCMALETPDEVNRDQDGRPYAIHDDRDLAEAWNSWFMRSLRADMLAGRRPAACQRCFREEDMGLRSHRLMSNAMFAQSGGAALARTTPDGSVPVEAICSLDLRLGNRCNLKCRMCSPVSSRATLPDYAALHGLAPDDPRLLRLLGPDWVSMASFHRAFERCAPGIDRLQFSGGEPLLVPEMTALLEGLVERGEAGGIDLHYVTNLTVLPERLFTLWRRFRRLGMVVSLDGIGAVGEYIRHPLRWREVDRNLRRLDEQAASLGCDGLHANITVQAYNVLSIEEIVTYVATALPHFGRPKLSLLYYPEHFSVQVLPSWLKRVATERLQRLAARVRTGWPERWRGEAADDLVATIEGIVEHMNAADRDDLLGEFRRWTQVMDTSRREDIRVAIPELAPLFEQGECDHG